MQQSRDHRPWRQGLVTGIDVEIIRGPDGSEMGILKKIKISDRIKRLELIGRHVSVKAFKDRISLGVDDIPGRMERARKRLAEVDEDDGPTISD